MDKIRVCFWSTTFQADIFSFAYYLSLNEQFDVVVVLEDIDKYKQEPIYTLQPITCNMLDKNDKNTLSYLKKFEPHLTIIDNHFPSKNFSSHIFNIWHSYGWKGPQDKKEFKGIYKNIKKATGKPGDKPNPNFWWNCAGPSDLEHRNKISGLDIKNLTALGSPFTDDIINNNFKKEELLKYYPDNFKDKKVILIALTWHFGKALEHWGDDIELFENLFNKLNKHNCAVILRMHDRKRFEPAYLENLEQLVQRFKNVFIKYKDFHRDNLLDILVSDIMISNYSGMLLYYYATYKPSIHIYPVDKNREFNMYRIWSKGKVKVKKADKDYIWKLSPEETGGLVVSSMDELEKAILNAINNPSCCLEKSKLFINKHMAPYDGKVCLRLEKELKNFIKVF